ncbi:MAG: (Fe-S)-binding protein [Cytophagaceae bacterium]|jgi:Fe-S oxidoreductase|nr:(Fe-S)-binding protein [Cytophagaceae bacterium]
MRENYHHFVLPFTLGFAVMALILVIRYFGWLCRLSPDNRKRIRRHIVSFKTISGMKEIMNESLLHLRIYGEKPLLGFMHMSLAFGWFLLIVGGHIESWYFNGSRYRTLWGPIFMRYFEQEENVTLLGKIFYHFMDFALLLVLTGLLLAIVKRIRKSVLGMANTTRHTLGNRIALTALWFIFPFRLFAESASSGVHGGGGFLTASLGNALFSREMAAGFELPLWWAYSIALGVLFVVLPFSRYLHIPTEMILIFLRKWGVTHEKGFHPRKGLQAFEVHSCPSCGVCLDVCPAVNKTETAFQAPYFIRHVRAGKGFDAMADLCLNCGLCKEVCPVNIDIEKLRIGSRQVIHKQAEFNHAYLPDNLSFGRKTTDVVLFTGCMGRLNPKTTLAVKKLFTEASVSFIHIDEEESICCGRPMMLAGAAESARLMIERNRELINGCNGKALVTTCPICYKVFKSDYDLDIEVKHHTQFLWELMDAGRIIRQKGSMQFAYHDPCELGRGSNCYEPPRELLKLVGNLNRLSHERNKSLCCGNNASTLLLTEAQRQDITANTVSVLQENNPDVIVTSCPMCKKNIQRHSRKKVSDIAEILCETRYQSAAKTVRNRTQGEQVN